MILDYKLLSLPFITNIPTKIVFGNGCFQQIGDICEEYGKSALLVTGKSSLQNNNVDFIIKMLKQKNIKVSCYHDVKSDPTVHQVNNIVQIGRKNNSKFIIGLGGGSVIDAAKAAALIIEQGGLAQEYLSENISINDNSLPLIAIPTTSGTGSELSKGAIISWPEMNLKGGIRDNAIIPSVAIVDPLLTLSLPIEQVKITGFDCLAHAIESYISKLANPITAIFSANAIIAVTKYLPIAIEDLSNIEARIQLSFNSMMMGYNLANSSTCLPHRLQYPLGTLTKTAHAYGLAALYPSWIKITSFSSKEKFNNVSKWIAEGLSIKDNYSYERLPSLFDQFMDRINLSITKKQLKISKEECKKMATEVTGNLELDPWWEDGKDLGQFFMNYVI